MKTVKVKTSELEGAALDWVVAKVEGDDHWTSDRNTDWFAWPLRDWKPSAIWSQCGPLIDKYDIALVGGERAEPKRIRLAHMGDGSSSAYGPSNLIAACRAIVASVNGEYVEIPEELLK